MTPKAVIQTWIDAFNRADADAGALANLYANDAVNHQVMFEPVKGKEAIRAMFEREFAAADMTCIPVHIFED